MLHQTLEELRTLRGKGKQRCDLLRGSERIKLKGSFDQGGALSDFHKVWSVIIKKGEIVKSKIIKD